MTTTQKITVAALSLSGAVLGYAEVRALLDGRKDDTISEFVWKANKQTTLLAFSFGVLCGHFFWQQEPTPIISVRTEATPT